MTRPKTRLKIATKLSIKPERVLFASLLAATMMVFPATSAHAYSAGSTDGVVAVLLKKYPLTTATAMGGAQITHEGGQLSLKQAGVYSYPANGVYSKLENQVKDGKIKGPTAASFSCKSFHCHVLQSGEKVYVTKLESKSDSDDVLKFTLISVENIDGGDGAERYGTVVTFKFKKGYLSESSPEDVESAIEAIMAPGDDSADSGKTETAAAPAAAAPVQRAAPAPPPPPPPPPPAPLPALSIGESSSQVLQAYGMPTKIIDLGKKKTFIYKDIKIVFTDDKISDMQPL